LEERSASSGSRNAVAGRIVDARRAVGLTQTELARQIGLPLYVLERFERGEADPSVYLDAISAVTNRPRSWLEGENETTLEAARSTVERLQRDFTAFREDVSGRLDVLEDRDFAPTSPPVIADEMASRLDVLEAEIERMRRRFSELEARVTRHRRWTR
jgi:transcriptional regulator with XRE-family HTH domain